MEEITNHNEEDKNEEKDDKNKIYNEQIGILPKYISYEDLQSDEELLLIISVDKGEYLDGSANDDEDDYYCDDKVIIEEIVDESDGFLQNETESKAVNRGIVYPFEIQELERQVQEAISGADVLSTSPGSTMKPPGISPASSVLRNNPPSLIGGDSLHRRQPHSQHTTLTPTMIHSSSSGSYMQSTISDDDDDDKSVRQAMETLLALEKLTTGHKTTPLSSSSSSTVYSKLSPLVPPSIPPPQPPPSFSRLPPDGHEFPPNYHESYAMEMNSMPVRNNNNNSSSLDDLDVLKSLPPPPPPPSAPPPAPRRSAIELAHQGVIPSNPRWGPDVISGSSVRDKIALFSNAHPAPPPRPSTKTFRPPDIEVPTPASRKKPPAISSQQLHDISYMDLMRTQSQMDLASVGSVSGYHSSASTDSSLSSSGYATLPRKSLPPATPTTAPPTLSRTISFSDHYNPQPLHARSQSLVNINSSNPNARRTSLNSILDQGRKSMSKLKGLVIPERVAEVVAAATPLPDLPEITPKLPSIHKYDTNSLQRTNTTTFTNKPLWAPTTLATPLWKAAPIPEYSPAFKRKPLTIYDKRAPTTMPPPPPTTAPPSFTSKEVHEDSDDNDSAVSSSRSSISPPPSPIPTNSSSAVERRVLKPYTVEAINRKNVLSSARHSSGKDDKIGSPLIQRKFEEEQQQLQLQQQLQQPLLNENNNNNKNINNSTSQSQRINYRIPSSQQLATSADVKIAYLDTLDASEDIFSSIEEVRPISPVIHTRVLVKSPPPNEMIEKQQQQQQQTNDNTKTSSPPPVMTKPNKLAEDRLAALKKKYDLDQMVDEEEEELEEEDDVDDVQAVNVSEDEEEEVEQVETPVDDDGEGEEVEEDEDDDDDDIKSSSTTATVISKEAPIEEIKEAKVQENAVAQLKAVLQQGPSTTASMLPRSRLRLRLNSNTSIEKSPSSAVTSPITPVTSPLSPSKIPAPRIPVSNRRSASVTDIRKAFEYKNNNLPSTTATTTTTQRQPQTGNHVRVSSLDSTTSEDSNMVVSGSGVQQHFGSANNLHREQFGSITSLASSTSLISQQELQSLIDEANQTLEEASCLSPEHEVVVVILHRELATGSVGITLAGGADYESKEITVHKVLAGSPADRDGRIQKGDRIISINGRSMKGLTHKDSLNILKTPRTEVVLVVSRPRNCIENTNGITTTTTANITTTTTPTINTNGDILTPPRTPSGRPLKILEQVLETNSSVDSTDSLARGPPKSIILIKDGAGLGFSLEGGKDSPYGDRPLTVKKIFTGGVAYKNGELKAGAELLKMNGVDLIPMSRIEAWSMLKKLPDGPVTLTIRPPVDN